jgi:prepilin-type N-terminal cleavage/methylation domain-containing protein
MSVKQDNGWRSVAARFRSEEAGFTLAELLVVVTISGIIALAISSAFVIGARTTVQANTRLRESHDAQLLTTYFRGDAASASYVSTTAIPGACSSLDLTSAPGGASPVALFGWTDAGVAKQALYFRSSNSLVRRYCEGGVKKYDVTPVKNLAAAATATALSCPPLLACVPAPAQVQLNVREGSGYSYMLQASPRTDPRSGGALGSMSFYIGGGGLTLGGNSTLTATGVGYIGGTITCNGSGSTPTATSGFYTNGGSTCGSPSSTPAVADPLLGIAQPPEPVTQNPATTAPTCVAGQPTFQPGTYTTANKTLANGCLAPGIYYFRAGAVLNNVTSAPGGVLIYVKSGDLDLTGNSVNLAPLDNPEYAGVTIFMGRTNAGTVTVSAPSNIDGILYAPAGDLHVQTPNNSPLHVGGIDVLTMQLQANVDAFAA